jgi:hypothetical protein
METTNYLVHGAWEETKYYPKEGEIEAVKLNVDAVLTEGDLQ